MLLGAVYPLLSNLWFYWADLMEIGMESVGDHRFFQSRPSVVRITVVFATVR